MSTVTSTVDLLTQLLSSSNFGTVNVSISRHEELIIGLFIVPNKQTNVFVKPRTSPLKGGHFSHALRFGPLGGARRTQMRSSALGVLPQCPRGLMLVRARHSSHCESNFDSFCRGCPTQRSRFLRSSSVSCVVRDSSRLGIYLVSPSSSGLLGSAFQVARGDLRVACGGWLVSRGLLGEVPVGSQLSCGCLAVTCDGS